MNLSIRSFERPLETLGVNKIETDNADFNVDYHEGYRYGSWYGRRQEG